MTAIPGVTGTEARVPKPAESLVLRLPHGVKNEKLRKNERSKNYYQRKSRHSL